MLDLDLQLVNNAPQEPASEPFEQSAALGNVGFTVTAGAGVFPVGAALRVVEVEADVAQAAIQSVEAAAGCEATHHLYCIQVLDAEGNPLSPNAGMELPLVRVKGLNLADGVRVFVYDRNLDGSYEIEANGAFRFQESGIYDIVCPARDSEETQKQPVEQPVEQPADQQEQPVEQPTETQEQPTETRGQPTETQEQPVEQPAAPQKPSPDGEGGAAQGAATDEILLPEDAPTAGETEETPTSSDPSDADPVSPKGEASGEHPE